MTGASTGIGEATALHLAARGWQVFASVRKNEDADRLRAAAASGRLTPVLLDVTDSESIAATGAQIAEQVGERGLRGLVNNAGIAGGDPLEFTALETVRTILEVNLVGVVAVTQQFLPLVRRGRGRVVCIGSIGGRTPAPFVAPYAASKAGLAAMCDSLRIELRRWGIHVALIEPGAIATPMWDKGIRDSDERVKTYPSAAIELYGPMLEPMRNAAMKAARSGIPVQRVARTVEHALTARRPRTRYLVGVEAHLQALLRRVPDRARDRLLAAYLKLP